MTNIAMEHPQNKWRFSSLGKSSISVGHGLTMAMLVITRGYCQNMLMADVSMTAGPFSVSRHIPRALLRYPLVSAPKVG